jgi:hypothetical protein
MAFYGDSFTFFLLFTIFLGLVFKFTGVKGAFNWGFTGFVNVVDAL